MTLVLAGVGKNTKNAVASKVMNAWVPTIPGFFFNGLAAGIKKNQEKDTGLIFSQSPAAAAGVFTQNWVKAAPVVLTQERLRGGYLQAVLVNSGCANACTGKKGVEDAKILAEKTARLLNIPSELIAVASTGVIGVFLPLKKMVSHLSSLCGNLRGEGIMDFSQAIMTTDTKPKIAFQERMVEGKKIVIGGIAKGAGMINPSLATMLVFILTNAAIGSRSLQALLEEGVRKTFNRITVDGDTSTNDTVLLLANGQANNRPLSKRNAEAAGFKAMLFQVMEELAQKIIQDGEGVTKSVEIKVQKAKSRLEAEAIARSIACSPLVKTSFYGEEVNWGRIIVAAGKTQFPLSFANIDLFFNHIPLVSKGNILGSRNEKRAQREMKKANFAITLILHQGNQEASIFTTDFSPEYVTINAGYKS